VLWGLVSDRMNERRWNLLAALASSRRSGLIIAGADDRLVVGDGSGLSIATFGFYGSKGPFLVDAAD